MRTLIDHVTVVTMDEQRNVYPDGYTLIEGQNIIAAGNGRCSLPFDERVDGKRGILMPGMVNLHCHIPMIPFRSMGDDCPDRLRKLMFPLEMEAMTSELVYLSSRYAIGEMLLAGVTTVLDMYYFEDEVAKACDEAGIRAWLGQTVIQMPTCDSLEPYGGLKLAEEFIQGWQKHDRVHPVVAPHATNTNSPEMLKKSYELAKQYGVPLTLHVSEMDYEMTYFRETYDRTPTEFLADLGILGPDVIAAHCIHMTDTDLDLLAASGTRVAHCIGSNTKAGKGIAPVRDMVQKGIAVGLGTDGACSGNTLDLFTQFRLVASCQKTKYHDRSLFPAQDIITLGTREGARALGQEQVFGSIRPGMKADLVLVETQSANMYPMYNPYSMLVYSANAANVDSVWVDGKALVWEKKLLREDMNTIRSELEAAMKPFRMMAEKYADIV